MKKLIVLGLLVYVGASKCMEVDHHTETFLQKHLPADVKKFLDKFIKPDTDIGIIKVIAANSHSNAKLHKIVTERYSNQEEFTALVHFLADRFNTTPDVIAKEFDTEASKAYLKLAKNLNWAIVNNKKDDVIDSIKWGADVNFIDSRGATPLGWAVLYSDIVEILLNAGAQVRGHEITNLNDNIAKHQAPLERKLEPLRSLDLLIKAFQKQNDLLEEKRRQIID